MCKIHVGCKFLLWALCALMFLITGRPIEDSDDSCRCTMKNEAATSGAISLYYYVQFGI